MSTFLHWVPMGGVLSGLGGGTTFSPNDIAGLVFWMDGDSGIIDISDSPKTITNSGITVTASARNGHDVFEFDGASYASVPSLFSGSDDRTLIVVYESTTTGTFVDAVCGVSTGTTLLTWFMIQSRDAAGFVGDPYFSGYSGDLGQDAPDQAWKYAQADYDGVTANLYKDGIINDTGGASYNTGTGLFFIGASNEVAVGEYLTGQIAAIYVYDSVLSSADRGDISSYISDRFAL